MKRRHFIKTACIGCAGSLGAAWLLEACTPNKYITNYQASQNKITLQKSEFASTGKEQNSTRKWVLLKPQALEFPLVVYKISETEYKSHLLKCTHQGCELTPYETAMVCPCHGAEFNTRGEVSNGPADTNLISFKTTHDDENIYIQL